MDYRNFKFETDADGIALVTWDAPGRSMNVIDIKTIMELADIVERVANDAAIKGAVVTSTKETFCAGADLTMLEVFSRYQTTLDNQLYKSLRALRDAQEWRLKTIEGSSVPMPKSQAAR